MNSVLSSALIENHTLFPMAVDASLLLSQSGLDHQLSHPLISLDMCQRQGLVSHSGSGLVESYEEFIAKYIEVQQIHKMELDRIFKSCDEYCTRYSGMLSTTPYDQFLFTPPAMSSSPTKDSFLTQAFPGLRPVASPSTVATVNPRVTNSIAASVATQEELTQEPETHDSHHSATISTPQHNTHNSASSSPKHSRRSDDKIEKLISKKNKKKRRGSLPKPSVEKLKTWLKAHLQHPYPSEAEKNDLVNETGLTLNQVVNWFINARRRIVQPMLDAENRKIDSSK